MSEGDERPPDERPATPDPQLLSPELALVDPVAAEEARKALAGSASAPGSAQTSEQDVAPQPAEIDEDSVELILGLAQRAKVRSIARRRRRTRRRVLVLLLVVLGASAVVVFRVVGAGDNSTRKGPGTSATATGSIPAFVWVPAKGAASYRIEFRRGAQLVYASTTSAAQLRVPRAKLPPGTYRWRVSAFDKSGARIGKAIVDASVTIR